MVKGKFLDDARGDEVKSRFVAQEVAYEVRDDVHAGAPGLKVLCILISMAAMQCQCLAIYDIVAAFLHAWMDELLAVLAPRGLLADDEVFVPVKALYGTRRASNLWQAWYSKLFSSHGWASSRAFAAVFMRPGEAMMACHGDDILVQGPDAIHEEVEHMLRENADVKILGRVGPGHGKIGKFLKRAIEWDDESKKTSLGAQTLHMFGRQPKHSA